MSAENKSVGLLGVKPLSFGDALSSSRRKNQMIEMASYAQLGTVTAEGFPAVRTVVIRGVLDDQHLLFSTDARSAKVQDLEAQPTAELCWYFALTKEQYRLRGVVTMVGDEEAAQNATLKHERLQMWQKMLPSMRASFVSAAPGQAKPVDSHADLDKYEPQAADINTPSPNFLLMVLTPTRCDYAEFPTVQEDSSKPIHRESILKPARQANRWIHTFDSQTKKWVVRQVNP